MTKREFEDLFEKFYIKEISNEFIRKICLDISGEKTNPLLLASWLEEKFSAFLPEAERICMLGGNMTQADRIILNFWGKVVALIMVLSEKTRSTRELRKWTLRFVAFSAAYSAGHIVTKNYDYVTTALDVLSFNILETGLDASLVSRTESMDVLSATFFRDLKTDKDIAKEYDPFEFRGKGLVKCDDGVLGIFSSEAAAVNGSKAYSLCAERVEVFSGNSRDEKLRESQRGKVEEVGRFAQMFFSRQNQFVEQRPAREYRNGQTLNICIVGGDENGISARPVGDDASVRTIKEEELIKGTRTSMLVPYLCEDDCIKGARKVEDKNGGFCYSIRDAYADFSRKKAERDLRDNVVFEAMAISIDSQHKRISWMTPHGYTGLSKFLEDKTVNIGDKEFMEVQNVQPKDEGLYINIRQKCWGNSGSPVLLPESDEVLMQFVCSEDDVLKEMAAAERAERDTNGSETVTILANVLANSLRHQSSFEDFQFLLTALFLYRTVDKDLAIKELVPRIYYLGMCILFAQGGQLWKNFPSDNMDKEKIHILKMLSLWNNPDGVLLRETEEYAKTLGTKSVLRKILSLYEAIRLSSEFKDQVKVDKESVRKKICSLLKTVDCYRVNEVSKGGKYGYSETHEVEFKSSYIYRNDGKGADIDYQGRGQVFEAVCAFLNAEGGTVYLGVNDSGEPLRSEDYGLKADMKYIRENHERIRNTPLRRGRLVVNVTDLDSYARFLDGEKELYFKSSLWNNITIDPTPDGDAIKISVTPSRYEIAYLMGGNKDESPVAYVRDGGRTVPMSRVMKERRLAELKEVEKEIGFAISIQEAIDAKKRLIFKGYSSGNSGRKEDRYVVPRYLFYNDENVYCYDLEAGSDKQFRLHRIESVEQHPDDSPYTLPAEMPKKADVFRWLDDGKKYHIKLKMEAGALNYLYEEYSMAAQLPEDQLYQDPKDGKWILDTTVYGLGAVRRFYLGLADKIEILDSEDSLALKKGIADFTKKNLDFQ